MDHSFNRQAPPCFVYHNEIKEPSKVGENNTGLNNSGRHLNLNENKPQQKEDRAEEFPALPDGVLLTNRQTNNPCRGSW